MKCVFGTLIFFSITSGPINLDLYVEVRQLVPSLSEFLYVIDCGRSNKFFQVNIFKVDLRKLLYSWHKLDFHNERNVEVEEIIFILP